MQQVAWILALLSVIAIYIAFCILDSNCWNPILEKRDPLAASEIPIDFKYLPPQSKENITSDLSKASNNELARLQEKLEVSDIEEKQLLCTDLSKEMTNPTILSYYIIKPDTTKCQEFPKSYEVYYPVQNLILKYTRVFRTVERPFATVAATDQQGKLEVMHFEYIHEKWSTIKPATRFAYMDPRDHLPK
jgi:hypothetical protein